MVKNGSIPRSLCRARSPRELLNFFPLVANVTTVRESTPSQIKTGAAGDVDTTDGVTGVRERKDLYREGFLTTLCPRVGVLYSNLTLVSTGYWSTLPKSPRVPRSFSRVLPCLRLDTSVSVRRVPPRMVPRTVLLLFSLQDSPVSLPPIRKDCKEGLYWCDWRISEK